MESKTRWLTFSFLHLCGLGLLFSSSILSSSGLIVSALGVHFPSVGLGRSPRKSAFRVHESCTHPGGPLSVSNAVLSFKCCSQLVFQAFLWLAVGVCCSQVFQMIFCCFLFFFSHRLQNHKDVGIICGFPPPTSVLGFERMSCRQFCYMLLNPVA